MNKLKKLINNFFTLKRLKFIRIIVVIFTVLIVLFCVLFLMTKPHYHYEHPTQNNPIPITISIAENSTVGEIIFDAYFLLDCNEKLPADSYLDCRKTAAFTHNTLPKRCFVICMEENKWEGFIKDLVEMRK